MPFYVKDLSVFGFWHAWGFWNQSPTDSKGWLLFTYFHLRVLGYVEMRLFGHPRMSGNAGLCLGAGVTLGAQTLCQPFKGKSLHHCRGDGTPCKELFALSWKCPLGGPRKSVACSFQTHAHFERQHNPFLWTGSSDRVPVSGREPLSPRPVVSILLGPTDRNICAQPRCLALTRAFLYVCVNDPGLCPCCEPPWGHRSASYSSHLKAESWNMGARLYLFCTYLPPFSAGLG